MENSQVPFLRIRDKLFKLALLQEEAMLSPSKATHQHRQYCLINFSTLQQTITKQKEMLHKSMKNLKLVWNIQQAWMDLFFQLREDHQEVTPNQEYHTGVMD